MIESCVYSSPDINFDDQLSFERLSWRDVVNLCPSILYNMVELYVIQVYECDPYLYYISNY